MILSLLSAATVAASTIEVRTSGDDGLTQRFADDFRVATAGMTGPPLRATIAQIAPTSDGRWLTVVTFSRGGREVYVARCRRREGQLPRCAKRAAATAKRLLPDVR